MQKELIEMAKRQTARDPKFYVDTKSNLRGTFCEIVTTAIISRLNPDDMITTYTVVHDAIRHTNHNQTTDHSGPHPIAIMYDDPRGTIPERGRTTRINRGL